MTDRPKTASMNISPGPMFMAISATRGERKVMTRAPMTPPFRLFPCRKKPIFMHLQHRHSSSRTFPQPAFQSFYFPFLRYRGFLQQFAFFHANAPKLHIQNTQFWRRSFKKIRAAPAAISSETVPQLYFPPKRADWYRHKAAQPFCIVLTSLFLLITIL